MRRLELMFGFFTVRTSTCGEIWALKVCTGGKSRNFVGAGQNPQEMPIEAEGREDIDMTSTNGLLMDSLLFVLLFNSWILRKKSTAGDGRRTTDDGRTTGNRDS